MGERAPPGTDDVFEFFVRYARIRMRSEPWDYLEPILAATWADVASDDMPPWVEISPIIRERCMAAAP